MKGDGNCLFNAVLQEMEFDTQQDEGFLHIRQIKEAGGCFHLLGGRRNMLIGLEHRLVNIYGWSDRYSESEPGPFSVKTYLKHILEDGKWGDIIVLYLIAAMLGDQDNSD